MYEGNVVFVCPRSVDLIVTQPLQMWLHVAEYLTRQFRGASDHYRLVQRLLSENGRVRETSYNNTDRFK